MLLAAMEEKVRENFRVGAVENTQERCRKILITAVSAKDKVLYNCCMLTAEIEEVHAETLLDMLYSLNVDNHNYVYSRLIVNLLKYINWINEGNPTI